MDILEYTRYKKAILTAKPLIEVFGRSLEAVVDQDIYTNVSAYSAPQMVIEGIADQYMPYIVRHVYTRSSIHATDKLDLSHKAFAAGQAIALKLLKNAFNHTLPPQTPKTKPVDFEQDTCPKTISKQLLYYYIEDNSLKSCFGPSRLTLHDKVSYHFINPIKSRYRAYQYMRFGKIFKFRPVANELQLEEIPELTDYLDVSNMFEGKLDGIYYWPRGLFRIVVPRWIVIRDSSPLFEWIKDYRSRLLDDEVIKISERMYMDFLKYYNLDTPKHAHIVDGRIVNIDKVVEDEPFIGGEEFEEDEESDLDLVLMGVIVSPEKLKELVDQGHKTLILNTDSVAAEIKEQLQVPANQDWAADHNTGGFGNDENW